MRTAVGCWLRLLFCAWAVFGSAAQPACAVDTLAKIHERGTLIWGGDSEGGGPYVYPNPDDPRRMTGFEVELADMLAAEMGVKARFFQGPWHNLPALLRTGQIDIVLNGYELTPARAGQLERTRPYYYYQLVLLGRRDDPRLKTWDDLRAGNP